MKMILKGKHPGQSSLVFMIDLNPSDDTCIYSTLHFVNDQAKRYDVTPVINFDQPLWWKAFSIILKGPNSSNLKKDCSKVRWVSHADEFLRTYRSFDVKLW